MAMTESSNEPRAAVAGADRVSQLSAPRRVAERDPSDRVLELYDAHQRELHTFVRSLEREPAAAEDIVAETFLRLTREIAAGRVPDQPRAWLHRVAANLVVSGGRHRTVVARLLGRLVDRRTDEPADAALLRSEARRELLAVLGTLPADARTALMLAAHGFSGREIASILGRSELATRSLISRARVRLRDQLEHREVPG